MDSKMVRQLIVIFVALLPVWYSSKVYFPEVVFSLSGNEAAIAFSAVEKCNLQYFAIYENIAFSSPFSRIHHIYKMLFMPFSLALQKLLVHSRSKSADDYEIPVYFSITFDLF